MKSSTGKARGEYEDFVTGFVTPEGNVWGRPVGITVAKDGFFQGRRQWLDLAGELHQVSRRQSDRPDYFY
jgi:hypothetical protein